VDPRQRQIVGRGLAGRETVDDLDDVLNLLPLRVALLLLVLLCDGSD